MNRKLFPGLVTLFILLALISCEKQTQERPNFVIIQMDDLGYDDLGIHGNRLVKTPNIDSIAVSSMQFRQFYVNPVCAPTRASLLTGRHFLKTGVSHVHGGKDFLNTDEVTFADILGNHGYHTGMWGKWHSGTAPGYYPWERGFDEAYMAKLYKHRNSEGFLNGEEVRHQEWADRVITDYAIDFMDRNREEPFLAYLSFLSVHEPLDTPDSLKASYMEKGLSPNLATLYGMVEHTDHYIGRFFHALDTMGLSENTIVMIMSDNGPAVLNNMLTPEDRRIRYISRMKGHKGNIWENGVRSPLFIRWQGVTQPVIQHSLIDVTDIFPTMLRFAGADPGILPRQLDGVSFCELITCGFVDTLDKVSFNYANRGWPPTDQPWSPLGTHDEYRPVPPGAGKDLKYDEQIISVRKGAFKLMHDPGKVDSEPDRSGKYVLIDILADPNEQFNLYDEMPEVASELEGLLKKWWQEILDEPGSFAMPEFRISGDDVNEIPAKAPIRISSNVKAAFAWLTHWVQKGDFAEYRINVRNPGQYDVILRYTGKPSGATFRASVPGDSVENAALLNDHAILGSLELQEGEQILRIELVENPSGENLFDRFLTVELNPR